MRFKTYAEEISELEDCARGFPKGYARAYAKLLVKDYKLKRLVEKRESVLQVLQARFNKVPKRIQGRVSELDKFSLLDDLFEVAVLCDSLKEFKAQLPAK